MQGSRLPWEDVFGRRQFKAEMEMDPMDPWVNGLIPVIFCTGNFTVCELENGH